MPACRGRQGCYASGICLAHQPSVERPELRYPLRDRPVIGVSRLSWQRLGVVIEPEHEVGYATHHYHEHQDDAKGHLRLILAIQQRILVAIDWIEMTTA